MPTYALAFLTESISLFVPSLWVPVLYLAWCWPLFRGESWLPVQSVVLAIYIAILSAVLWASAYDGFAWQYHGSTYVLAGALGNILAVLALVGVYVLYRHHPSFQIGLLFHVLLFLWLGSYALPYLGEFP